MKFSNYVEINQNHFLLIGFNLVFEIFKMQDASLKICSKTDLHHCQHHN